MKALAVLLNDGVWVGLTLASFGCSRFIYHRSRQPLLHPVLLSTLFLVALVTLTHHSISAFRRETMPLVWLLGPAVVAMAVPVWQRRSLILANWPMLTAVVCLSMGFSIASMLGLAHFLDRDLMRALTMKFVTAPVALGIAKETGVRQDLTLVGVMMSGLVGMVAGPLFLSWFGAKGDRPEVGAPLGCASHGLGTARALEIGPTAGAFASVCMGLSAIAYGLFLPPLLAILH